MREFNLPINDPRIISMTEEQLDFMIWGLIMENPESSKKLEVYYDPDFDEYWDEFQEKTPDVESTDDWEEV